MWAARGVLAVSPRAGPVVVQRVERSHSPRAAAAGRGYAKVGPNDAQMTPQGSRGHNQAIWRHSGVCSRVPTSGRDIRSDAHRAAGGPVSSAGSKLGANRTPGDPSGRPWARSRQQVACWHSALVCAHGFCSHLQRNAASSLRCGFR